MKTYYIHRPACGLSLALAEWSVPAFPESKYVILAGAFANTGVTLRRRMLRRARRDRYSLDTAVSILDGRIRKLAADVGRSVAKAELLRLAPGVALRDVAASMDELTEKWGEGDLRGASAGSQITADQFWAHATTWCFGQANEPRLIVVAAERHTEKAVT